MFKMCTKCFYNLPYKMFYNCVRNWDGKQSWCKDCQKKSYKSHYDQKLFTPIRTTKIAKPLT